jgi:phage protein D
MPVNIDTKLVVTVGLIPDLSLFSDVIEVVVDTNVYLPSMCTITIVERVPEGSPALPHVDNMLKYKVGEKVVVSAITSEITGASIPLAVLFTGEVTSIEPIFEKGGVVLRIRAFDKGHRLTKGKKFRSFVMMTDAIIATTMAGEAGLIPQIVPTRLTTVYPQVIQYNQSNWDFLWERANLYGYQMYVDNLGIFHYEPAGLLNTVVNLTWTEELVKFEPRLDAMGQVTNVEVGGWDPKLKMPIMGMAPGVASVPTSLIPGGVLTGPLADTAAFGTSTDYLVDVPMSSIGQAMAVSQGLMDGHANQYVRASGEVNGCIPNLRAGSKATIKEVGIRFTGTYFITEARMIYRDGNFRTLFEVSGQNPYTIRHLLNGSDSEASKIKGVVIGVVTNLMDPLMMGRVKVKFPWIPSTPPIESDWARVASVGGGSAGGMMILPEINDEVLVAFEHGDINYPYIVGMLWNGIDRPPDPAAVLAGKVVKRTFVSRSGHTIVFDDTTGKEAITIVDKSKMNSISIDSVKNEMTIKAQGNLNIEAGAKLTIKGLSAEITATQGAKISAAAGQALLDLQTAGTTMKGMKVDVQAQTQANIQSNAQTVIKSTGQVSVEGTGMVQIQGALVKIN